MQRAIDQLNARIHKLQMKDSVRNEKIINKLKRKVEMLEEKRREHERK